ncbi:MAG: hypothetical protein H8E05_00295 [Bacteroidetes bacterium]|nr:hypothetical protein [Bacteroidota bacterium]
MIELTEEQKNNILEAWNKNTSDPPALLELIKIAFPDQNVDGRSKEGRAVKAFLSTVDIKARGAHEYQHKDALELNSDQIEFIQNHYPDMASLQIAKVIFDNDDLGPLNQEARVVAEYIKNNIDNNVESEEVSQEYKVPTTFNLMLSRINRYIAEPIDKDRITNLQKKETTAALGYISTYRFIHQISRYNSQRDRDLLESTFIRYVHDKPDLSQEEVDQFILLSTEVVIASNIQDRVERLRGMLDDVANDTDGRRISMALVESINTAQTEYNQSVTRQQKLLSDLKEKRSDKLKKQIQENASILNLVEMWKEEESRNKMIKLAELRKQAVREEAERLGTLDEVKARILGLTQDEL